MKKTLFFLFLFGWQFGFSQVTIIDEDEIIDELLLADDYALLNMFDLLYNYKSLYASVNYTNKTYFAGRELKKADGTIIDQISITPQIYYISSKGLILGVSGLYLSESVPNWDTTVLTLGYGKTIGKNLNMRYETTYSRYIFGKEFENSMNNSLDARFLVFSKDRRLGTEIEFSYIFGDETAFNTTISLLGNFKIKTFDKNKILSFQPQFSIYLGQETIELYKIRTNQYRTYIEYYNEKVFDMINTQLNLPLNLSLNDFDIELGYNVNIPNRLKGESSIKNTSFINLACRYTFDL